MDRCFSENLLSLLHGPGWIDGYLGWVLIWWSDFYGWGSTLPLAVGSAQPLKIQIFTAIGMELI